MSNIENEKMNVAELTNEQMEKILAVAKENNIDVTAEQITEVLEKVKSGELSDDELDGVTGGINIGSSIKKFLRSTVKSELEGVEILAACVLGYLS